MGAFWSILQKKPSYDGGLFGQYYTHIQTRQFYGRLDFVWDYPGESVPEPIWILLKQETVSGSGISLAICKSAPCTRQITVPSTPPLSFLQVGCPSCCLTNSIKALVSIMQKEKKLISLRNLKKVQECQFVSSYYSSNR